mgnify:CR=1 FL=1
MPRIHTTLLITCIMAIFGFSAPLRAASIRFLPLDEEIAARKLSFRGAKKATKIKDLSAQKRSAAYPFVAGKTSLVLVALDREDSSGKPVTVAITLPPEISSPLILILPDAAAPSGLRTLAVEDSNIGFPWGSLRLINTTGTPFLFSYGGQVKQVSEAYAAMDILPDSEVHNMGVQLLKPEDPQAVLYSAVWEHDLNIRKLIFILPGADAQPLNLKIIPEDKRSKKK